MGGEVGGLKPVRRLGRQESPLSRDTLLTAREKEVQTTESELAGSQTESAASKAESKMSVVDTCKTLLPAEVAKSHGCGAAVEIKSSASSSEVKPGSGIKAPSSSFSGSEAATFKSKPSEKMSPSGTSKGLLKQDSKQQSAQTDSGPATKAQEKTEEKAKGPLAAHKGTFQKAPTEQLKQRKGTDTIEKGASYKASDTTKLKGPTPVIPNQGQAHAAARCKEEKPTNRGVKEERQHLEVLEENPMSPPSNAASPASSKSRPMSPGDKTSFVTQLTSVAKTVLGPMKGGSQEGGKVKDISKSGEEKRGSAAGKGEASSGSLRRGAQTAASTIQSDKGNIRSSKHHL